MKCKVCCISVLCMLMLVTTLVAQITNILYASSLKPVGRYWIDNDKNLELISSAVHFGFGFSGKQCTILASINDAKGHNYLQYELDGKYQKKIRIEGDSMQSINIDATSNGNHTIEIYKCTEAATGPIIIHAVKANDIRSIKPSDAPMIEFIGNSITCGADADTSDYKCGQAAYHDYHNAYYAYGPRVARALNVNYMLSSVSGIGIYRTWNMDSPNMPMVYEKESFNVNDTLHWNFKTYSPKIVSIALGTNDMSHGDGVHARAAFDSAVFVKDYIAFVQLIKSKYPKAIIALLSSPMINGNDKLLLQNCLIAVKQNIDSLYSSDNPVALFFFEPMKAGGCSGHPSVADHAILANELLPFFSSLLK